MVRHYLQRARKVVANMHTASNTYKWSSAQSPKLRKNLCPNTSSHNNCQVTRINNAMNQKYATLEICHNRNKTKSNDKSTNVRKNGNDRVKLTNPWFIDIPSFARSPVAPVRFSLSEPARSTKLNFALSVSNSYSPPPSLVSLWNSDGWTQSK